MDSATFIFVNKLSLKCVFLAPVCLILQNEFTYCIINNGSVLSNHYDRVTLTLHIRTLKLQQLNGLQLSSSSYYLHSCFPHCKISKRSCEKSFCFIFYVSSTFRILARNVRVLSIVRFIVTFAKI